MKQIRLFKDNYKPRVRYFFHHDVKIKKLRIKEKANLISYINLINKKLQFQPRRMSGFRTRVSSPQHLLAPTERSNSSLPSSMAEITAVKMADPPRLNYCGTTFGAHSWVAQLPDLYQIPPTS